MTDLRTGATINSVHCVCPICVLMCPICVLICPPTGHRLANGRDDIQLSHAFQDLHRPRWCVCPPPLPPPLPLSWYMCHTGITSQTKSRIQGPKMAHVCPKCLTCVLKCPTCVQNVTRTGQGSNKINTQISRKEAKLKQLKAMLQVSVCLRERESVCVHTIHAHTADI